MSVDCIAMGSKAIFIIFGVLSAAQVVLGSFWEFGNPNIPESVVIAHTEGYMGLFEHSKTIKIAVPQCYYITYVRVTVKNIVSTPKVQFNPNTNEVYIHYDMLQSSLSSYDVLAKAVWRLGCLPQRPLGR